MPEVSGESGRVRHVKEVTTNEIGSKVVGVGATDYADSYVFKRPTLKVVHHILH